MDIQRYTYIYLYTYIYNIYNTYYIYKYIYTIYIYIYKLNSEGIQYDIIDTSSFMLHAIFRQYFYL